MCVIISFVDTEAHLFVYFVCYYDAIMPDVTAMSNEVIQIHKTASLYFLTEVRFKLLIIYQSSDPVIFMQSQANFAQPLS